MLNKDSPGAADGFGSDRHPSGQEFTETVLSSSDGIAGHLAPTRI